MKNRWTKSGAQQAVSQWGPTCGELLALRLYSAQLLGADSALVLHGGGNVSVKSTITSVLEDNIETLFVKGSGFDLATLSPDGLSGLDLAYLRRLRTLDQLTDEQMVNELRTHLFDAGAPTPSIETLLHAFLPHRYVDHSHADALLTLTNQRDGDAMVRDALGERVAILPYIRPGFELAKAVADCYDANPQVVGIVLLFHGLVTFGEDAETSYDRHIELVDACETFIRTRAAGGSKSRLVGSRREQPNGGKQTEDPAALAARVAPILRGIIAQPTGDEDRPFLRSILEWRAAEELLEFIHSADGKTAAASGPLTCDHLIHTKPRALYVAEPAWSDESALRRQIESAMATYRKDYHAYATTYDTDRLDAAPRVILLPGAGLFCWGPTKRAAQITADIAEHTLLVKSHANAIGPYTSLPDAELFDMEFRPLQQRKLKHDNHGTLQGQVVVISGGAGAIGSAVAQVCAEQGAYTIVADIGKNRIDQIVQSIEDSCGPGTAHGVLMDVTDEESARRGFEDIVRTCGGVDVLVPNAGVAHVAALADMEVSDFRRVMEINTVGYMLFMREGIRIMKRQELGGNIVINASKNVFGPGKDFGAYSASKAAGHQLGKVAAIELAADHIRVNMINTDAVFGDENMPSGLWATVGPQRAKSRNLSEADLPEYYRRRNLLRARITGRHVGNAVVFFASNATPTTGATLPVDGGVIEAFPR